MDEIIVFDTETTGLEPGSRLVELAALLVDVATSSIIERRQWLIDPEMPIPPDVIKVHGITDEMVKCAPTAHDVLREFFRWETSEALVAHYARYDTGIISWEASRNDVVFSPSQRRVLCTKQIAESIGATRNNKLETLVQQYHIPLHGEPHRALTDAEACARYFLSVQNQHVVEPCAWNLAGHDYEYVAELPEPLETLPYAVEQGAPLSFRYTNDKDETTERTITPYGWAKKNGELYFHGFCHLRQERRTFRVDRVLEVLSPAA